MSLHLKFLKTRINEWIILYFKVILSGVCLKRFGVL